MHIWISCLFQGDCNSVQHGEAVNTGPFEDEETKALYESLPDIRAMVPAMLLGSASEQQDADAEPDQTMDQEPKPDGANAESDSFTNAEDTTEGALLLLHCMLLNMILLTAAPSGDAKSLQSQPLKHLPLILKGAHPRTCAAHRLLHQLCPAF